MARKTGGCRGHGSLVAIEHRRVDQPVSGFERRDDTVLARHDIGDEVDAEADLRHPRAVRQDDVCDHGILPNCSILVCHARRRRLCFFAHPPRYESFAEPEGDVVDVLASAFTRVCARSADGSHYTSDGELPLIPGIDGVGRTPTGELLYFVLPDGAMAERVAIDPRRSVPLPADCDVDVVAAGMNPATSSWVALRRRIDFRPGARVLVLGAAGNAGRMALEVARLPRRG